MVGMRSLSFKFVRKNLDCVILCIFIAVLASVSCLFIYGSKLNNPPIRSDGFSYYAYLPSVVIDHDLSFRLAREHTPPGVDLSQYSIGVYQPTGKMLTIVPPGTAILEAPFFIAADLFTSLSGGLRSGYSQTYQAAIVASGIFYLCLGSLLVYVTLRRLFGKRTAFVTVLAMVFATSVFHYGTYDNSFSHIYSFAAVGAYLYLLFRLKGAAKKSRTPWLLGVGLSLGLVALIRVPNIIVGLLLIPVLYENKPSLKQVLKDLSLVGGAILVVFMPYILYLIYTTGSVVTNPYSVFPVDPAQFPGYHLAEGKYGGFTNLRRPEIINFLFSVRKGLFFWSPILVLAFASIVAVVKKFKGLGIALGLVFCLAVYLCSSWWAWAFGGSFGSRPFVDLMPLLALSLAAGIGYARRWVSIQAISGVMALFIFVNMSLMYAYWRGYISIDFMDYRILRSVPKALKNDIF